MLNSKFSAGLSLVLSFAHISLAQAGGVRRSALVTELLSRFPSFGSSQMVIYYGMGVSPEQLAGNVSLTQLWTTVVDRAIETGKLNALLDASSQQNEAFHSDYWRSLAADQSTAAACEGILGGKTETFYGGERFAQEYAPYKAQLSNHTVTTSGFPLEALVGILNSVFEANSPLGTSHDEGLATTKRLVEAALPGHSLVNAISWAHPSYYQAYGLILHLRAKGLVSEFFGGLGKVLTTVKPLDSITPAVALSTQSPLGIKLEALRDSEIHPDAVLSQLREALRGDERIRVAFAGWDYLVDELAQSMIEWKNRKKSADQLVEEAIASALKRRDELTTPAAPTATAVNPGVERFASSGLIDSSLGEALSLVTGTPQGVREIAFRLAEKNPALLDDIVARLPGYEAEVAQLEAEFRTQMVRASFDLAPYGVNVSFSGEISPSDRKALLDVAAENQFGYLKVKSQRVTRDAVRQLGAPDPTLLSLSESKPVLEDWLARSDASTHDYRAAYAKIRVQDRVASLLPVPYGVELRVDRNYGFIVGDATDKDTVVGSAVEAGLQNPKVDTKSNPNYILVRGTVPRAKISLGQPHRLFDTWHAVREITMTGTDQAVMKKEPAIDTFTVTIGYNDFVPGATEAIIAALRARGFQDAKVSQFASLGPKPIYAEIKGSMLESVPSVFDFNGEIYSVEVKMDSNLRSYGLRNRARVKERPIKPASW